MNAAELQGLVDNRYRNAGGLVRIEPGTHDLGAIPLRLWSKIVLAGLSPHGTRLIYSGEGDAIRFAVWPGDASGYHSHGRIENLSIDSAAGGIGLDSSAKVEGSGITLRGLSLRTNGRAVNLRRADGTNLYNVVIDDVGIVSGDQAIDLHAINYSISRLDAVPMQALKLSRPAVQLAGFGMIQHSRIEGDYGAPMLQVSGTLDARALWIEAHGDTKGIVLDKASVTVDQTMSWFAQPKNPVRLRNGSRLNVAGIAGWTDNNGGKQTTAAKCYLVDGTSSVREAGKVIVGVGK